MNERAQIGDPYELALVLSRQLGQADRCRLVDAMLCEMGPLAPIPQTEDTRADAVWWMQTVPDSVKRTYFVELWCELSPDRQAAALKWFAENRKEAANALSLKGNVVE